MNGKLIPADILEFRPFTDGTARLALDHNRGVYLIQYDYSKTPPDERGNMQSEPEALEFNGNGVGKAFFKEGWHDDPETGARTWKKPFIPCRVKKVPYDKAERTKFEAQNKKREAQKKRLEEEKQRLEKQREQAELDREYKASIIAQVKSGATEPAKGTDPIPGPIHGKLTLKKVPNGYHEPAVFSFGRSDAKKPCIYTVPAGKAWTTVCELIKASAFDGHGHELAKSPNDQFKGNHRPFFTQRMTHKGKFWWITTS